MGGMRSTCNMVWDDMSYIYVTRDRDHWWALVRMVMNFGFHKI